MEKITVPQIKEDEIPHEMPGIQKKIFTFVAVFMSLFHLYVLGFNPVTLYVVL